ncbi:uncharacterized protein [Littorina saxatilis]|uniref:uncharacterized protein n=1 Tax=Littorina saxatilis TaxID=31220 RepID=UPI0038B52A48
MTLSATFVVIMAACMTTLSQGKSQGQDSTLQEGARGSDVVDAVVEKIRSNCILSEDRLFVRRAAYVASRDGADSATYRPNFHGGIWQVTEAMFTATKDCNNDNLVLACSNVSASLGIQWSSVTWSELRKPLYSGIAAALSTLLALGNDTSMPGSLAQQGDVWAQMYGGSRTTFTSKANLTTNFACDTKMDLVFILDSSGSVFPSDFQLMLQFAANVVDAMDISPDGVLVADIVYSSNAEVHFNFNDYTTKAEAKSLLLSTYKINSGTSTYKGLDMAADILYNTTAGARKDATKVAILITDGKSNFASTNHSAQVLKELGTTVFAVGVGGYYLRELQAAASDPICTHVLTLTSFHDIQSILTDIQKSACEASLTTSGDPDVSSQATSTNINTAVPEGPNVIEAVVFCGVLDIYVSTTHQKPGPALYDYKFRVTPGKPTVLTVAEPAGTPLYVTVVGTPLSGSAAANCSAAYRWNLRTTNVTDTQESCDCDDEKFEFENPCTPENLNKSRLRHPHPFDTTKFLLCDLQGQVYVVPCPEGKTFNKETLVCGFTSPPHNTSDFSPLPGALGNPCTPQAIANGWFYFTYNPDQTKFIQCDEWGNAWVMPCAPTTIWSQGHYTCIKQGDGTPSSGPAVTCSATDISLPDPCDQHSYYICDHLQASKKQCYPASLFYDTVAKVCIHSNAGAVTVDQTCYP